MRGIICAVSWVVMSEVMTTHLRSKAFGLFVSINWGINLIIGLFTLTAIDGLGGTDTSIDDDDEVRCKHPQSAPQYRAHLTTFGKFIFVEFGSWFRYRKVARKGWL
jgi:hypothetical protein